MLESQRLLDSLNATDNSCTFSLQCKQMDNVPEPPRSLTLLHYLMFFCLCCVIFFIQDYVGKCRSHCQQSSLLIHKSPSSTHFHVDTTTDQVCCPQTLKGTKKGTEAPTFTPLMHHTDGECTHVRVCVSCDGLMAYQWSAR